MISLEETVIRKLRTAQHILCSVESCTGGLIANLLTNIPGASEVYWGSFITYDNSAKQEIGVANSLIKSHSAASVEVAREMAEMGLLKMQQCSSRPQSTSLLKPRGFLCVSTTGVAGPTGGSREKPVGLCFIGLALSGRKTLVEEFRVTEKYDRTEMKVQFAHRALDLIRGTF